MTTRLALVRAPGPRLADGIVTHIQRESVDVALAEAQWRAYRSALEGHGWRTVEAPPADECPDAVFIEDTVVAFGGHAVLARPGAEARRAEVAEVGRVIGGLGVTTSTITAPATLDGGDVLKVGSTVYVGRGGRTNAAGVAQLADALTPLGATVIEVPVTRVLHLKSAVTALPDGTVIGYPPLVDDPSLFERFLAVPEESGSHVVLLDDRHLLMAADCPRTARMLEDLGYRPVPVDISEFQKLEGCVTCLSVRLRQLTTSSGPPVGWIRDRPSTEARKHVRGL